MTELTRTDSQALETLRAEVEAVRGYVEAAAAPATRRAYASDWRRFSSWCEARGLEALPALPETVATFLASEAEAGRRASTIGRRVAAIRAAHERAGAAAPTSAPEVRVTLSGIRRKLGTAPERKAAATSDVLRSMLGTLDGTPAGLRDRALLLLGFTGAFRRGELAGLDVSDLAEEGEGLRVRVRRSKTDQEGRGTEKAIPRDPRPSLCPVAAVRAWLEAAGIQAGPVFRPVSKGGSVGEGRLTGRSVARIVKRAAARAGYDADTFGGHSLRAGLVTSAASAGRDLFAIMDVTGHRSVETVRGYVRRAQAFENNAAAGLL